MPLTLVDGNLGFVRLWMPLHEFPRHLVKGLQSDPSTRQIERQAKDLISRDFPDVETIAFVRSVCSWGHYAGVGGRVIKHNSRKSIVSALRNAHEATTNFKIAEALTGLLELRGLAVSFASKHLKFLDPTRHVVLDSIISSRLGYEMTVNGYCEFLADCQSVLKRIEDANVLFPSRANADGEWLTSKWQFSRD